MRREEFLEKLEMLLDDVSLEERDEAMAFYRSYFEEAGEGNEEAVLAELESPEKVAEIIKRDLGMVTVAECEDTYKQAASEDTAQDESYNPYGNYEYSQQTEQEKEKKNTGMLILIVIIAILTSPGWIGILAGVIGTLFGLAVSLVAITFAMFVVGVAFVGLGIAMMTGLASAVVSVPAGLAFAGSGFIILAIALLLLMGCVGIFGKFIPWAVKSICNFCKKPFARKEA